MAEFTITIPPEHTQRVLDRLSEIFGWDGEGNQAAFVKQQVVRHLRELVRKQEARLAARTVVFDDPGIT